MSDRPTPGGTPDDIPDLLDAMAELRYAVATTPAAHPARALLLHDLSLALQVFAHRTGDIAMLRETIKVGRDAVAAARFMAKDHPIHLSSRANYRNALVLLSEYTDDLDDLRALVQADRDMIAVAPQDHPDRVELLYLSWADIAALAERAPEPELLDEVADVARAAVAAIPLDDPERPAALVDLLDALLGVFEQSKDVALLTDIMRIGRDALRQLPHDHPRRKQLLSSIFSGLLLADPYVADTAATFEVANNAELLGEIAGIAREAVADTPPGHAERAAMSHRLCCALRWLAGHGQDESLQAEIVRVSRTGIAWAASDSPVLLALLLDQLCGSIALADSGSRHMTTAEMTTTARETVAALPTVPARVPTASDLVSRSAGLRTVLDGMSDQRVLRRALLAARLLLANIPGDDPRREDQLKVLGQLLQNLSLLLQNLFEQTHELPLIEEAVQLGREAHAAGADNGDGPSVILLNFGLSLERLYAATSNLAVLDEAVRIWRDIVSVTTERPEYDDLRAIFGNLLAMLLGRKPDTELFREFERVLGAVDRNKMLPISLIVAATARLSYDIAPDLTLARDEVDRARQALASGSLDEGERATLLTAFGSLLLALGHRTKDREVLEEAVLIAREAVAAYPDDDPDRVAAAFNLAGVLQNWSDATDDLGALQEAARISQQELAAIPDDDPERPGFLSIAVGVLKRLAERTGDRDAMRDAMQVGRASVDAARDNNFMRAGVLSRFGLVLSDLHQATGDLAAIEEAVQVARKVVAETPPDTFEYSAGLVNLGSQLRALHDRTNDPAHLAEALRAARAAASAFPADQPGLSMVLVNQSMGLAHSFRHTGNVAELEEAIRLSRRAVVISVNDNPLDRVRYVATLADHLGELFNATQDAEAGDECLRLQRKVIAMSPEDHPLRAVREGILGAELARRMMTTRDRRRLPELLTVLRSASASAIAPISTRISAGRLLEFAEMTAGNYDNALAAMELVVELLPRVAARTLARSDREYSLGRQSGVATQAAATAVAANRPEHAVELLEQCRGILLGEAMDDRSDLAELSRVAPELAADLAHLRSRLTEVEGTEPIGSRFAPGAAYSAEAIQLGERRRELAERWSALLAQVRALPGFERFLRPPDIGALRGTAVDGPVVMIFVHGPPAGGHALIVPADPRDAVRAVPLPALTVASRIEQLKRLDDILTGQQGGFAERARAETDLHALLEWLWDTIASPVLTNLGIGTPTDDRPRVWWCPIGDLAFLPIQAAGYHRLPGARTVLDRTVSSFITTLRALEHGRAQAATSGDSAVLVAMPETPAAPPLPSVDREVTDIAALLPDSQILRGGAATTQSVAEALARHSIAHIACHALTDPADPSASRLLLHDHETEPFTVGTLMRLHLNNAELAYLSACSTTRTSRLLADEALHLTAAIHLAGYRHVIGTLWPINDGAAAAIATDFYRCLTSDGRPPTRTERSAHALNEAIRLERARNPSSPSRWAAHVHHGL